jgi:hypothetical protein
MKGIVISTDNQLTVRDFGAPLYKTIGEAVDGWIEIVRPGGLKSPYVMVVNEEGLIKELPINIAGSILYGTPAHGSPIVGNIVIMKEGWTDEGKDLLGLSDEEVVTLTNELVSLFQRAGKSFIKEN